MGTIHHNSVLVTTCFEKSFERIRLWIDRLPEETKRLFVLGPVVTNGYQTVVLIPDGSKEGWSESDDGDSLRAAFIEFIKKDKDDFSDWIEVGYGELGQEVLRGNCTQ